MIGSDHLTNWRRMDVYIYHVDLVWDLHVGYHTHTLLTYGLEFVTNVSD